MKTLLFAKFLALPVCLVMAALTLNGCGVNAKSAAGFRLPEGNKEQGRQAFKDLQCASCHSIQGGDLGTNNPSGHLNIVLGGESLRIHTYGELVTSIINPSHVINAKYKKELELEGKLSSMPDFNKLMTVQQMVDLVAFLQPQYRLSAHQTIIAQ